MGEKWPRVLPTSTSLLGSFTCRKVTTWDRRLYFPSEGRRAEDFFFAREIRRFRPGSNPLPLDHRSRSPPSSSNSICLCAYLGIFCIFLHVLFSQYSHTVISVHQTFPLRVILFLTVHFRKLYPLLPACITLQFVTIHRQTTHAREWRVSIA
jgi:hypothetical protein